MTRRFVTVALAIIVPVFLLAVPASADQSRGGSSSGGSSQSSGGGASSGGSSGSSGGGSHASGGGGHASGGGGGHASGGGGGQASGGGHRAASGGSGAAVSRGGQQSGGSGTTHAATGGTGGSGTTGNSTALARHGNAGNQNPRTLDGAPSGTPQYSRPRDGRTPVGTAVPRGAVPAGGSGVFIPAGYYGGLYPFGYGYYGDPYGYYGGYYGGYYDPWYGGYPSSVQTSYGQTDEEGALRLKVKPKEAEVYVDGYYAGIVDDFNGVFQKLHLETGVHRVEIRAPGYEPLTFEVRITAGHKSTYEGELKRIP